MPNINLSFSFIGLISILLTPPCLGQQQTYKSSNTIRQNLERQTEPYRFQANSWEYSYIGQYYEALKTWDQGRSKTPNIAPEEWARFQKMYKPQDARSYILQAAQSRQITIINEAHHQPPHRLFTKSMLQDFYKLGYHWIGFETLSYNDSLLDQRKYPLQFSGSYSKEPQYGDLIRMALEIGYGVFPYENASPGSGKLREIEQAQNIKMVFAVDANAKILIHCGFAHAFKDKYPAWEMAMAGRLKEYTGIDPLTIDQTNYTECSSRDYETPLYKELAPKSATVYVDSSGSSYRPKHLELGYDIMVFHPRSQSINGRPSWLFQAPHREVQVKMSAKTQEFPVLLMAYKKNEDPTSGIPCDIVEVNKAEKVHLALRTGTYQLVVQNEQGARKFWKKVQVK